MKILLRNSPEGQWKKLEPFEFGGPDGEEKLQSLLEKSPDLLADEGGKPVLFFRTQVAVGDNAVDLLGVDAVGTIVMVECKLEANREARRMVVGQILEYAGQLCGASYEEFEEMLTSGSGLSLAEMARQHISEAEWSEADFRAAVEQGLESGDFRLVIAVNGMNDELKGIVEYLKVRGGIRLEALELRQFQDENTKTQVLVPEPYGTARRTTTARTQRAEPWDWKGFAEDAIKNGLADNQIKTIKDLHDRLQSDLKAEIIWGRGTTFASFGAKWVFTHASVVWVASDGTMVLQFGALNKSEEEKAFRRRLQEIVVKKVGLPVPEGKGYPDYDIGAWGPKTKLLVESLKAILPPKAPTVAKAS
jgi:hypothetical protein